MKSFSATITVLLISLSSFAQQTAISGKVTDKISGEEIIGAIVFLEGTSKGTTTNFEGSYTLPVEPGNYKVSVNFISYKPYKSVDINVKAWQSTPLNVQLEENYTQLAAVEIVGTRQTNTELAVLELVRQSEVVVSGLAGDQIAKSIDRDAAETVKRIPGVTVLNDKYVVIRGMNQRYNTVQLNGALTPSTEPDQKAFSFDVLPASVIDRIMVYKNGSPELPGEFAGGIIKIFTKNVVSENKTTFGVSGSYRAGATFKNFLSDNKGSTDLLGFDNGMRSIPAGVPSNLNEVSGQEKFTSIGRAFRNNWAPGSSSAAPDLRMSLGLNRKFYIGDVDMSTVSAVSYSNTQSVTEGTRKTYGAFDASAGKSTPYLSFHDKVYGDNVRLGLVSNWSARINNSNKIEFRNLFNQLGSNEVLEREGIDYTNGDQKQRNYSLRYESRTIYSGQFQGTHDLTDKSALTWTSSYNYTYRNEPDYRRLRTFYDDEKRTYKVQFQPTTNPSLQDAGRFYSALNEQAIMASSQYEHRFGTKASTVENASKIRTGIYAERKSREYSSRFFSFAYNNNGSFDKSIAYKPLDRVFAPENINSNNGLILVEDANPQNNYQAANTNIAGFVSGSSPLTERLSASGGVRVEYNNQELTSKGFDGSLMRKSNPVLSLLPSANFTYDITQRALLRAGGSVSVNRPEFREIAPSPYFDFVNLLEVIGNPKLDIATIYNTDLRYEFYPNPTEIISIGGFLKYFNKPIESVFENTPGGNTITFENAKNALSYGLEAEIRKSLLDVSASQIIQNTSLVLNAALVQSKVQLTDDRAVFQPGKRAMVGQSPYVLNTGIYYQDDARKLQFSVLYNVIGKRIYTAGSNQRQAVYEMPRHQVDLSLTKSFGEHLEFKAGIQDLLNQRTRLIQDSNDDKNITSMDESFREFKKGQYTTLGITYKF